MNGSPKKFLWAQRLWVGTRKENKIDYVSHKPTENRTREPKGHRWIIYIYTMHQ